MRVYLALGSNLGSREGYLRAAVRGLLHRHIDVIQIASLYSTEPRDVRDQPWFLNTALQADTRLAPDQLLAACLDIENENHRIRNAAEPRGPRTLDIDIIFYGAEVIRQPNLTIPHPRFTMRRFVLVPLAEIAANFIDPVTGKTIGVLLQDCPDEGKVHRAGYLQQVP